MMAKPVFGALLVVAFIANAPASSSAQSLPDAQPLAVAGTITQVTAYRGRAAVTRTEQLDLSPGVYDVSFTNLPESVHPQTLQARASGNVRVIGVEYDQRPTAESASAALAQLDAQIKQIRIAITRIDEQYKIIAAQGKLLDDITARMAADASKQVGAALDLDALTTQIAFLGKQREELMNRRLELDQEKADLEARLRVLEIERQSMAGSGQFTRSAIVSVVCTESGRVTIELTYLVANATWEPVYNIRANMDGSSSGAAGGAQIEYDAMLTQRTGEDWDNVKLTLSTAQPAVAANPPPLTPWFVDVFRPMPATSPMPARPGVTARSSRLEHSDATRLGVELEDLQSLSKDAEVTGDGPAVSFELPRTVTVKTNVQRQQRTRIATINAAPKFTHVAIPSLTEAVYVRGDLVNGSPYQLLPGRASIFIAQDYVGPTTLAAVPPNGEFKLHFGIDTAVKATRQMVTKKTENTGLLSGGRRTVYDYRLSIDNGAGKPITVELCDRYPISRSSEIQIETTDLSHTLATDAKYVAEEKPQGMLKWVLPVPANAAGRSALVVTYGVRIHRAKDIEMTPLPE